MKKPTIAIRLVGVVVIAGQAGLACSKELLVLLQRELNMIHKYMETRICEAKEDEKRQGNNEKRQKKEGGHWYGYDER